MKDSPDRTSSPSLALLNGRVWTGWPDRPEVQAVAVSGGRIIAAGSNRRIQGLLSRETNAIDLAGARVLSGFYDSHVHLVAGGLLLSQVSLRDAADEAEFGRRLSRFAAALGPQQWVLGGNWDEDLSLDGRLPDRTLLDRFVSDRPVFVRRYDGHIAGCNSRALELAEIGPATPDPAGGRIDRGPPDGEPTGILRDAAIGLVTEKVPRPSEREIADAVVAAMAEARRFGVTSVDDMGGVRADVGLRALSVHERLAAEGRLTVRIRVFLPLKIAADGDTLALARSLEGEYVSFGGFKAFADGSLGARTAWMFEPYLDVPETTGLCVTPPETLQPLVARADAAGLPVAVHAIGDRAIKEVLDVFEAVIRRNGPRSRCLRVEHVQHVRPQDVARFAELGVAASMQPVHAIDDARFSEAALGRQRLRDAYPWRPLLDAGAELLFGSDWPVATLNPLAGIDAAVNARLPKAGAGRRRISAEQAVRAYALGRIGPGEPADMVVLSADILDPDQKANIAAAKVTRTIVAGEVYEL